MVSDSYLAETQLLHIFLNCRIGVPVVCKNELLFLRWQRVSVVLFKDYLVVKHDQTVKM